MQRSSCAPGRALLALVVAASLVLPLLPARPARATHQSLQWNENGDGFAEFGPGMAVEIYQGLATPGTCDGFIPATDIYVVTAVVLLDKARLTDVSNAEGVPNTVQPASGGLFVAETIAFTTPGGFLGGGTYGVVYDECQDGLFDADVDKLFYPAFTVVLPVDAPPIDGRIARLKADARAQADSWNFLIQSVETLELLIEYKELAECLAGGLASCIVSLVSDALQDYVKEKLMEALSLQDPQDAAKDAVLDAIGHYGGIAADPPDPDFRRPSPLRPAGQLDPRSQDPLIRAIVGLGNAEATEGPLVEALLRSIERYQGADAAANGEWALVHARSIRDYAARLAEQLTATNAALAVLDTALAADSRDLDAVAVQAATTRSRITGSGFDAEELRFLRNLGRTPAQIEALRADMAANLPSGFTEAALRGRIADLVARNNAFRGTLTTLVTDMGGVVDTLQADPNVLKRLPRVDAGGPYSVAEGAAVTLNGAGSADPDGTIAAWAWDLDRDGQFDDATGARPTVTFPRAFDRLIGLEVTDNDGRTGIGYARATVADANRPPMIGAATPAGFQQDVLVGSGLPFSVTATDPDGDPVTIRWLVDFQPAGTGPSFTSRAAAASEVGMHVVRAEVSDGLPAGGTIVREWGVSVRLPDADGDGWHANADCDDAEPAVSPGRTEVPGNGKDDDCNPATLDAGGSTAPTAFFNPVPTGGGRNVALLEGGATVHSVSSEYSAAFPAQTILDRDPGNSYWATGNGQTTGQWIKVLLAGGRTYVVDRVRVMPAPDSSERVRDFEIAVSTTTADDAAFTRVLAATAAPDGTLQEFMLPKPALAKYVRYSPLNNRGSSCCIGTQQLQVLTGQEGGPTVSLQNLSTDPDNDIVSYSWDFGDGSASTTKDPTHTFPPGSGTYNVALTATDASGQSDTTSLSQRVLVPPTASFTFSPTEPEEGEPVVFSDTSGAADGGILVSSTWHWGDGSASSAGRVASHVFADNGSYTVTLEIVDDRGQTAQTQQTVNPVNAPPTVNVGADRRWLGGRPLSFGLTNGGGTIAISDPGSVDARTCRWDFGDGSPVSSDCAFNHTYSYTGPYDPTTPCTSSTAAPRVFTATLTVTDDDGGVGTDSLDITVQPELIGASIVINGSFESPAVENVFVMHGAPLAFGGWMVEFGSVDHISPAYFDAACGGQSVDLTGNTTGALYQDLSTVPGQAYKLRFAMAGNLVDGPAVKRMEVWWGSSLVDTLSFDTTGRSTSNMGWRYHDYRVVATASATRLRFRSLTDGFYGPAVDDIVVVQDDATPPATATATVTSTPTPAGTETPTPTNTVTLTPTATSTATQTPAPPSTSTPLPTATATATPTATPTPAAAACALYPMALHTSSLAGVAAGTTVVDILNGWQPGNFGWLSWTGDPSAPTLAASLRPPGDSATYVNPADPADRVVSLGDWVPGRPGVSDSDAVRDALDLLKTRDIVVPVWDATRGQGGGTQYRVAAFARIRLLEYRLPEQQRISARFLGYATCGEMR